MHDLDWRQYGTVDEVNCTIPSQIETISKKTIEGVMKWHPRPMQYNAVGIHLQYENKTVKEKQTISLISKLPRYMTIYIDVNFKTISYYVE